MPAAQHHFEWEDAGGVAVVRFTTNVLRDERIIRGVFDQLERLVEGAGKSNLVLNFGGMQAFASYAIGKLIMLNRKLRPPEGRLALCNLTPAIDEIVDIMKLRREFNIYPTEPQAIESFS